MEAVTLNFNVLTLDNSDGRVVQVAAGTTVRELREKVASEMDMDCALLRLIVGDTILEDDRQPVSEACGEVWEAALAGNAIVDVTAVVVPKRSLSAANQTRQKWEANNHGPVFVAKEGCPTAGDYDHESCHYWPNHSGGGTYIRLELPETHTKVLEVKVAITLEDQGWGGTGAAGVCVVLLDADGKELAFSASSLQNHGSTDLEWTMTPEEHGGKFPDKKGEEYYGSVCGEGEGLALEVRPFTPNWGGWSVEATTGKIIATIIG
eukprot:TRINITY_DN27607_c0_g1_i1.p1 TRINITY_DN27607_c0_g1~~TRINITY_DN27607_c0_g1_i1.p1  ORF type:complete len:287 (+),score=47.42 TRINITY_DN27607_c0_g1_i1:71-862(+)